MADLLAKHKTILTADFLLHSDAAKKLYYGYATGLPIIDYHNHLPPKEIAEKKKFNNLTEIWLKGDQYKWRAMQTLGISEELITDSASDEKKFHAWAACVPQTIRNPLFHWTLLELNDPFQVKQYLNPDSASNIYSHCNEQLGDDNFSTTGLLSHFKVEVACTTDDPYDDLKYHKRIALLGGFTKVLPGFRPDKVFNITKSVIFKQYLQQLEIVSGRLIVDFDSLVAALLSRVDYFHASGCRLADHGFEVIPLFSDFTTGLRIEFKNYLADKDPAPFSNPHSFCSNLLVELCKMYHAKNWVQQFHLGALRNTNSRFFDRLGPDSGFDSIGDQSQARSLAVFLNELDKTDELARTILYNVNPADNEVFAAMTGNFNDGSIRGKIQFGSGWWFLDQVEGMTRQLNTLSSIGMISTFIGMLTDSRSFLSFSRHEYFRRLVCNMFGAEIEAGLLPNDEKWIGQIIQDICYHNARQYLSLNDEH